MAALKNGAQYFVVCGGVGFVLVLCGDLRERGLVG
jgi:hypothetical protein